MREGMPPPWVALQEKGAPLQVLEGEEGLLWCASAATLDAKRREGIGEKERLLLEPRSVLESRRSPSPPSSASTLSSSVVVSGGGPASSDGSATAATPSAAAVGGAWMEVGVAELPPVPASLAADWETLFSDPAASIGQDQNFVGLFVGEVDNPSAGDDSETRLHFDPACVLEGASVSAEDINPPLLASSGQSAGGFGLKGATFGGNPPPPPPPPPPNSLPLPPFSLSPEHLFQESTEEKPLLGPSLVLSQKQRAQPQDRSPFFLPFHYQATDHYGSQPPQHLTPPTRKRPASDHFPCSLISELHRDQPQLVGLRHRQLNSSAFRLQPPSAKSKLASGDKTAADQQQQVLTDQLFKAAELLEAGKTISALGILARLNHQLPSPTGKPHLRSAFYFKEALHLRASNSSQPPPPPIALVSTPSDVVLKLRTCKAFSDVSPIVQFVSFTCVQALLETLNGANRIHIIDFDIGVGVQWSALMQELAHCWPSSMVATPCLKITAFISSHSHHPLELHLIRQNLFHLACSLNIPFEFDVLNLESFDPLVLLRMCSPVDEAVAVNLPVGSAICPPILNLVRFVKQLSPNIVFSIDYGCDRIDLPFAHHVLHAFQSCTLLLDSIDAVGANQDAANKIERFIVRPRIESAVLGRHHLSDKMLPWRSLFASTGFVPKQFSNVAETQAECLLKRVPVRGFYVEKRQASLSLCWQQGEIVSVSAWKC